MQSSKELSAVRIAGFLILLTCALSTTAQNEPVPPPEPNPDPQGFLRAVNLNLDHNPDFSGDVFYEVKNLCGDSAVPVEVEPDEEPLCYRAPVATCISPTSPAFLNSQVLTAELVNFSPGQPDLLFRVTVEPREDNNQQVLIDQIKFVVRCLDIFSGEIVGVDATRVAESAHRKVFVTSETYTGDLGGVEGADAKCNALAQEAGLLGTYKAWINDLHDGRTTEGFTTSRLPYVRIDGVTVADDYRDLVNCRNPTCLKAPINVDEHGSSAGLPLYAWTYMSELRQPAMAGESGLQQARESCYSWNSSDPTHVFNAGALTLNGLLGELTRRDKAWTYSRGYHQTCNLRAHLYCFQQ